MNELATIIAMRAALRPDGRIAVEVMRAQDAPESLLREGVCALVEGLQELVPTLFPPDNPTQGQPMN